MANTPDRTAEITRNLGWNTVRPLQIRTRTLLIPGMANGGTYCPQIPNEEMIIGERTTQMTKEMTPQDTNTEWTTPDQAQIDQEHVTQADMTNMTLTDILCKFLHYHLA